VVLAGALGPLPDLCLSGFVMDLLWSHHGYRIPVSSRDE
jgi:hypothetical protein